MRTSTTPTKVRIRGRLSESCNSFPTIEPATPILLSIGVVIEINVLDVLVDIGVVVGIDVLVDISVVVDVEVIVDLGVVANIDVVVDVDVVGCVDVVIGFNVVIDMDVLDVVVCDDVVVDV